MSHALAFLVGVVSGWVTMSVAAQVPAPDSQTCRQALAELQARESAALALARSAPPSASVPGAAAAGLQPWRDQAARACLGAGPRTVVPARTAQPPVTVPPVTAGRPLAAPVAPPLPTPAPPAARSQTLLTVVACDATGCWASDGSRLSRAGPNLVGPRGTCTLQGAILRCP